MYGGVYGGVYGGLRESGLCVFRKFFPIGLLAVSECPSGLLQYLVMLCVELSYYIVC